MAEDDQSQKQAENFLKLYEATWSSHVAAPTAKRQRLLKLNKNVELPISSDLMTLTTYLNEEISQEIGIQQEGVTCTRLSKLLLTKLILFNKRRPAECAEMKVEHYVKAQHCNEMEEVMQSLSAVEKVIAEK